MSTTNTTYESFAKPDVGTEENAWGTLLNTIFDQIDVRLGGVTSKSVAGASDVTLSAAEARAPIQIYTGTLTGNIAVIVPTNTRVYAVYNNTGGAFTLTVKTSAGTGIVVPQGGRMILLCDGTNVEQAFDDTGVAYLLAANDLSDVANAATAFGNIKQAATTSATGVVELATGAEVVAGTDTARAVTPAGLTTPPAMNMADRVLTRPKLLDYGEAVNAIGAIGGGTQDIDIELGNVVTATVDTSETTFTFSNPSASGTACSFTLELNNGGSQTVNWPASVTWAGGTEPTLTASGTDVLVFFTADGGTTWRGFVAGLGMS